jgi:hypothetical protein
MQYEPNGTQYNLRMTGNTSTDHKAMERQQRMECMGYRKIRTTDIGRGGTSALSQNSCGFLHPSRQIPVNYLMSGHDRVRLDAFQFITHYLFITGRYTGLIFATQSVVKDINNKKAKLSL